MVRVEQVGNRRWQGPLGVGLAMALCWPLGAMAQTSGNTDAPKAGEVDRSKLTDAERARRDADRVFNFIKFHAVKPAAAAPAAAAAAPRPAARPAAVAASPAPAAAAPTPTATQVGAAVAGSAAPAPVAATDAVSVAARPASASPAGAASAPGFDPRTLPPASPPAAVAAEPAPVTTPPAAEPEPAEEVDLKMVKYVAPELDARAIAAATSATATVRVRFVVMPDGSVGKVSTVPAGGRSSGAANRALAAVATRAVSQWRFEPVKEAREVEVDVDFRFD
jgi:TonB family protein